ncbi:DEAD/DEAH box helicase [Nostoc sp. 'Peltigera membranacea cyanobiont' 232]|uniref:DEAD/DEAH box helicase n=1 Tax=Nostoc sp. 'Peltigera membranacea cyanobiont' 232 TaxID=2014531 RepID=UPI000B954126|nr:DEAD/DEAH box helicase [Nostoc sp. 'Peltigera membranacea cyanobiont' 232]OYE00768.1 DEAD/DEAH box helicase [Nostoc sp. 'Peltigera membranacea cyanobiont' 232]
MTKYLDPIAAVEQPRADFIRYLLTAYPLRDPHLRYGFKQLLEQPGNLWQHPYLEGSQPYKSSLSINDLVEQGVLHPEMATLFIPSSRRLYEHQEKAIRAVVEQQQNIVVATGTGSGKTECFLTPMLDMLLKEGDNLSLAGVRVLILYPMNALVNDQVKRLRQLLCRQKTTTKTKFGFYTSRTEKDKGKAIESLREEFAAYDPEELRQLFTSAEIKSIKDEELIDKAIEKTSQVQLLSREEMWEAPPHILITNYSMLEHMLIRPKEREKIFEASVNTFKMLVVDEAHTYDGAKGSEVSMLLERFKASVGVEQKGKIRCIATSASLGDASVDDKVIAFAGEFFGETFSQVIRGQRLNAKDRLGKPYTLPAALTNEEIIQYLSIIELPQQGSPISSWFDPLSAIVPEQQLKLAESQADSDIHKFLWFALKGHPLIHRLINILCREPKPWEEIVRSTELWGVNLPIKLDGSVDDTDAEVALAHLLQIGTLARANPDDLPLLPVRLHLLFRSLEGLYACINPKCSGAAHDPIYSDREVRYGQLYLNEKKTCECCGSPVLELGSCSQCGQGYVFTQRQDSGELESLPRSIQALKDNTKIYTLTSGNLDSVTEEEEMGEDEEEQESTTLKTFKFELQKHGWIGKLSDETFTNKVTPENEFILAWHRKKNDGDEGGCYLNRCAACGAGTGRTTLAINRFVTYTDGPLEAMLDSLFELLPETEKTDKNSSKRKILTFSDGRQDAAFFASDYQRTHTEMLYRQMLWQAFNQIKNAEGITSVNQLINQLKAEFLEFYIPHPDRKSDVNYKSYRPNDPEEEPKDRKNKIDAEDLAQKRAKEILVKEFALYFNRRLTLEAFALLTCHIELEKHLIESVAGKFEISNDEAQILLTVITDIIRRTGIVSIEGSSSYFQETGGDGRRPEMIDAQGKSKNYLFLEKSDDDTKKYKDSPSFMPWKQGKVRKPPNRLGWYFLQIFGEEELPNKEDFIWLFRQLQDFGLLVSAKKGFQLNWGLLNIFETRQDWYKCNCCQQIFHVPSLSKITLGKLSVQRCSAYKCGGTLESYTPEKIEQTSAEHYQQYLIKQRLPLPLRSQEHTAQLGVAELEKRENRFRQGRINMLSCSTTLEMGVDIGELQAVVLRNFPPHVSNYQQRAGRAGRRTDGVAITLMYGQRRPHDRFYFEQPKELIAGSNQIPKLDSANFQIQQRHIHAELLAAFLRENWNLSAEEIKIAEFLDLPLENPASSENFTPAAEAKICKLQQWLNSDEAAELAVQWLTRLGSSESQAAIVLRGFKDGIEDFQEQQLQDWNSLAEDMLELRNRITDPSETKNLEKIARLIAGTKRELDKIGSRRLHNELAQASILPIYGFPIDVVRLLTGESNEYNSAQGKHRLERDRRLALGEYAPDQEIIVDDRMYKSVGILKPTELEQKFYWVCQNCNHFLDANTGDELVESCPVCGDEPSSPAAKKMKLYKVPKAFTTDWEKLPEVTPYIKPQRQPVSQIFLINDGDLSETLPPQLGLYTLTVSKGGNFFLANQGSYGKDKGFDRKGFAICTTCGRDLSDLLPKGETKKSRGKKGANKNSATSQQSSQIPHTHPRTGKPCSGRYTLMHLGHEFCSDLLKIVFDSKTEPTPLFGEDGEREDDGEIFTNTKNRNRGLEFWRSLTYALLAAAAQVIDVPRTELDGLFTPRSDKRANIIIYDNVPGGAGYSRRVAERFDEVLKTALKIVSSCNCATSCYDCLQTYSNQPFHNQFNRHLVADFLIPIVEQVSPDEELQKFAPNSNRISLSLIADILPAVCRAAAPDTLIYLPKLIDEFGLNKGSNLPWLNLLTDAVYSMRPINKPLELIVNHLPDPNTLSDASLDQRNHLKVWRKRLQQLIDQGLVKLYQVCAENLHQDVPTLCFNSNQSNRIALSLQQFSNNEPSTWFQTRSPEGVKTVFSRLEKLRQEARLVQATELEDINTTVIFLNPSEKEWRGDFSMSELRNKLRLEAALSGSEVTKIIYRDRYLREEGASILVELLKWGGFDTQSHVEILTTEDKDAKNAFTIEKELKKIFVQLQPNENNLSIRVKRSVDFKQWSHLIPHGRVLEIYRQDGLHYQVIFDIGMTFLARERGKYRVKFTTYVVVEKTI